MILFPYMADTRGGSVRSSFLLVEELLKRGRQLRLVFHGEGYARDLARANGFPLIDMGALGARAEAERSDGFRLGNLAGFFSCRRVLADRRATLVHVNDKRMLRTWALPAVSARLPLLAHWRTTYLNNSWSVDVGLRLSARIVCISYYNRDQLPPWARRKSSVVYNPFLPAFDKETRATTRQRIRHSAGIPTYAALIGFFGSLISRKQPHVLLKLLLRLRATGDGRPVHGLVCGEALEPRDEIYYKMLASENWQGRLVQAGYVDNARDWMAACDVVIAPAFDEAFGRVGVEAQSAGVPVIVSSDAGLREVVEHGVSGLVVDPGNFEGWVEQVGSVLNNADLARHLAEAGQRVAAPLTIEHHADQIEAIYAEIPAATVR